jgi:2-iminobutanoate/2-iminopropanoate deaminase
VTLRFDSLPTPQFRYSPAVRMGPFIKTAGMVGLDPKTGRLVSGGAAEEFRQILANLDGLIADNCLVWSELMSATLYTTAFHRFPEINAAWNSYFGDGNPMPARTAVGVSQLPLGAQVEADFLFYVDAAGDMARASA